MRKKEDQFKIPIEEKAIKEYFEGIKYGVEPGSTKKGIREAPKQFKAAIKIVEFLMSNKGRVFSKADLISGTGADFSELTPDSYKHAITFLQNALIITNVQKGKTTIDWGFNPDINIYVPMGRQDRLKKSHMVVSTLYPELTYDNFEIAKDIFKSQIYKFNMPTFYDYDVKDEEEIPVCDPEKIPYWKEEMELVKRGGYSSQEEFNEIMYQRTADESYLPQSAKDLFVF